MAYQVIARKYRPQRFGDVVGQEHVTQTLSNAIQQNRIAHAYLFCGPRGTGKTTIARIFAKCLNCENGPSVEFSDDDPRCREIAEGRSLDVIEIDGASNRGIDEIRDLRDTVRYAPATSAFKVYIIDEVHMLTKEAFNALLKTLEEPPSHVKFMFATTEPEKVLPTILSRCQRFDLRRIPAALIAQHLAVIATQENVRIGEQALFAIARGADGGMRDAESTLDQLISFCGEQIEESDVLSMFGLAGQEQLMALALSVLNADVADCLSQLDTLSRQGKDLSRLLSDLLGHFRNLLIHQLSPKAPEILELSESELQAVAKQARLVDGDTVGRIMEVLSDYERRLRSTPSKRILMEVAIWKAVEARNAVSIEEVLKTLDHLRSSSGATAAESASSQPSAAVARTEAGPKPRKPGRPAASQQPAAPTRASEDTPPPAVASTKSPPTSLEETWSRILASVGKHSPFSKSYLLQAHPVSLTDRVLTIGYTREAADSMELADNPKIHELVQQALTELSVGERTLRFELSDDVPLAAELPESEPTPSPAARTASPAPAPASEPAPSGAPAPQAKAAPPEPIVLNPEDFKNDPHIRKALDAYRGTIVDVRPGTAD